MSPAAAQKHVGGVRVALNGSQLARVQYVRSAAQSEASCTAIAQSSARQKLSRPQTACIERAPMQHANTNLTTSMAADDKKCLRAST